MSVPEHPKTMRTYLLLTFGCKSNQYESQAMRELLAADGFRETTDAARADFLVVNTCGVTGRAGASCRNAIRRAIRANEKLRVVVTGCGVDIGDQPPEAPHSPEPVLLIPNAKKHAIATLVRENFASARDRLAAVPNDRFALNISAFHSHTRAFLKIQDGCDNFCAYCAVPMARGTPESRPPTDILDEARRLVDSGHREIVLTGINIGRYRHGRLDLAGIAAKIAATPGLVRLRLGSVEPPHLTPDLAGIMREYGEIICPHVHLPLQSGDDRILAAMGRRYHVADFLARVELLKTRLDRPAITTDIIVGFPGEDDAAAAHSAALAATAGFSRLHVFLFSARPGTAAALLPRTGTDRQIEERKNRLLTLGKTLAATYAQACVGLHERLIIEASGAGMSDRYVKTRVQDATVQPGDVVRVRIAGARDGEAVGRVLSE